MSVLPPSPTAQLTGKSFSPMAHDLRVGFLRQPGGVVWLTGLSGAGKSTLAKELEARLVRAGRSAYILDGDDLRYGLSRDLGFSPTDRHEHMRRVGEVARLFADAAVVVIVAVISPYAADRAAARACAGDLPFIEVHVDASIDLCETRDPKGLYRLARAGSIANLTGIGAPYEIPSAAELHLDTGRQTVAESVQAIWQQLISRGLLSESSPSAR